MPTEVQPQSLDRSQRNLLIGLLALTFAAYASTLTFGWVWDDWRQIASNADLQWRNALFLLTHHQWASPSGTDAHDVRYFRPVLQLWLLINKSLFGLNPHWFHLTTVLAHVGASAMAFLVCRMLLGDVSAALFAAAIFALHPIQAETASWVSDVDDSLLAIFSFASFFAYLKAATVVRRRLLWCMVSLLSFGLALLTKEVAVAVPAVVLLHMWTTARRAHQPCLRRVALATLMYGVVAVLWIVARRHALGGVAMVNSALPWGTAIRTGVRLLAFYLGKMLLPIGLGAHYDVANVTSAASAAFLISLAAIAGAAALAVYFSRRNATIAIACAWILLPLAPALCVRWMNQGDAAHDRYAYMSMLGVALLAGTAYCAMRRRIPDSPLSRVVPVFLITAMTFATAIQSQYWASDAALFARSVKTAPNSAWSHYDLGLALEKHGKFDEAESQFVRSYQLDPGFLASRQAADCFLRTGHLTEAESWYARYLNFKPDDAEVWFNLGKMRIEQHRPKDAVAFFLHATALAPATPGYHFALGYAYEQADEPAQALEAYQSELRINPLSPQVRAAVDRMQRRTRNIKLTTIQH